MYFTKPGCKECAATARKLEQLREVFPEVTIVEYDIKKTSSVLLNEALGERFGVPAGVRLVAPAVFCGGGYLIKDDISVDRLGPMLARAASVPLADWLAVPAEGLAGAHVEVATRFETTGLGVVLLAGLLDLDTRALTGILRDQGAMRGAITDAVDEAGLARVLGEVRASPKMDGLDLVPRVTCAARHEWTAPAWRAFDEGRMAPLPPADRRVVVYDFGVKENILRQLREVGCQVIVVPATTPADAVLGERPDGVLLSNGPGDPGAVTYGIAATKALVASGVPVFGICLGHQILGLALGARTFKLPFGHHGGNHPVADLATGKVEITAQNHGFAVDPASLPTGVRVSHVNLFDGTCAGIAVDGKPLFSVQYHPEASPGPHDASYLFRRFRALLDERPRA